MNEKRFDPKKLNKLNNPDRLKDIPPKDVWNKLNLANSSVLVDIGAGTGFFSIPFVNLTNNGKVFACDISDTMITWMDNNVTQQHPNVIPVKMDENKIPLENAVADLVYMFNLHHELDQPEKMLAESFRLLKETGKILIIDWKKEEMPEGPPVEIRCTPEEVKKQLTNVGFKDITIHEPLAKHFFIVAKR